jgi:hypothetical protein
MVVFPPIYSQWSKSAESCDLQTFLTLVRSLDLRSHMGRVFSNYICIDVYRCTGLLCDLLWSDPDKDITGWSENDRGVSFTFGPDVVSRFLQKHDMDLICRAHQVCSLSSYCSRRSHPIGSRTSRLG